MKKTIKITGNRAGVNLSIPADIYFEGGAEFFARIVVGNIEADKKLRTFALNRLKNYAKKHNAILIINGKTEETYEI